MTAARAVYPDSSVRTIPTSASTVCRPPIRGAIGFADCRSSDDAFFALFAALQADRLIP
jgi:hypothetical protein